MNPSSRILKVLVLDDYEGFAASVPSYETLRTRAQVVILKTKLKDDTELAEALHDVQILLPVRERTKLGDKELALAPVLKFISQTGAGIGHLDLAAATRRKIAVCLTGSEPPVSTIELTMALILSCLRKIPLVDRRMRAEAWPPIPGYLLAGKTVGIVGLGQNRRGSSSPVFGVQRAGSCHGKNAHRRARASGGRYQSNDGRAVSRIRHRHPAPQIQPGNPRLNY